jgi:hypothetical protein
MRQNSQKKPFFFALLFLLIFLCCLPAASRAVQSGSLPEVTDTCVVPAHTTVTQLGQMLQLSKTFKLTAYKTDGSIRSSGYLATGDRVVVRTSSGDLLGCILITVEGQSSPSSAASEASSHVSPPPASETSEPGVSSVQPAASDAPSSASESDLPQELILEKPISASSAAKLLLGKANRVTVIEPDGSARKDGLICTGDQLVLQDESGNVFRTITVTVLGDLTRCGRPTGNACSILYDYLTGNISLPSDLSAAADVNRDQRIDTADLLRLKQKLLENSSSGE